MSFFFLTYDECRARFRRHAAAAGAALESHPIAARGPDEQRLALDVARLGAAGAARVLLVFSGTHGIEGYAGSAIQQRFLAEDASGLDLPPDAAVWLVHAVNPWGFAWWRRQNESNVDLNRNFIDHAAPPPANRGYAELHPLLCPKRLDDATERHFQREAERVIAERGLAWAKDAISRGQYEHPDGLYYGGAAAEESNRILRRWVREELGGAREVLGIDLHTGHGAYGSYTLLSNHAGDSPEHAWLAQHFDPERLEVTLGTPNPVTPDKVGQMTRGLGAEVPEADWRSFTFELGTVDDLRILRSERAEHWLHFHGDRGSPRGRAVAWEHRVCSIPDARDWEASALAHGRTVLDDALAALFGMPKPR